MAKGSAWLSDAELARMVKHWPAWKRLALANALAVAAKNLKAGVIVELDHPRPLPESRAVSSVVFS